jgi:hypothetical protein
LTRIGSRPFNKGESYSAAFLARAVSGVTLSAVIAVAALPQHLEAEAVEGEGLAGVRDGSRSPAIVVEFAKVQLWLATPASGRMRRPATR